MTLWAAINANVNLPDPEEAPTNTFWIEFIITGKICVWIWFKAVILSSRANAAKVPRLDNGKGCKSWSYVDWGNLAGSIIDRNDKGKQLSWQIHRSDITLI